MVIIEQQLVLKGHYQGIIKKNSIWVLNFYSSVWTTFKHASTNSVNIGSCMYSSISTSGYVDLSSNVSISLTCGFSRHFFNSFDCSEKNMYLRFVIFFNSWFSN